MLPSERTAAGRQSQIVALPKLLKKRHSLTDAERHGFEQEKMHLVPEP